MLSFPINWNKSTGILAFSSDDSEGSHQVFQSKASLDSSFASLSAKAFVIEIYPIGASNQT